MRRGLLAVLLTGQTMLSMDGSIVNVALPHIRADLNASGAVLQLTSGAYILALAVLVVTGARLGDLFGHRRVFLLGLSGFAVASLACGLAPGGTALVLFRGAQGAAAALALPQVMSLIQLNFSGPARARALGFYSMVLALGVAIGQVAGGVIVSGVGWRPVFLINVPVGAVVIVLGRRILPVDASSGGRRIDVGGVAILSAAMTALVLPLVFGRERHWPAWTWVTLAAACAALVAFASYERRAASPLLDLGVLRVRGVLSGLLACCAVMGAYTALIFSLSLHLQLGLGFSPLRAGLAFLPYTIGFATAGLGWPRVPARRALPVAGPLCFAAAVPMVALAARHGWPVALASPLLFVAGAGHAAGFSPLVEEISAAVGPRRASAVSAVMNTGVLLSGVIAIATLGGVFLSAPRPADGLTRVSMLLTGVLVVSAGGAWLSARRLPAAPAGERPGTAPPRRETVAAGDGTPPA